MPEILQQERSECGVACLAMVSAWWRRQRSPTAIRRIAGSSSRGHSLSDLVRLAGRIGLDARPLRVSMRELDRLHLPAILHWRMNHYVVLVRVSQRRILVHDPAIGRQWMSKQELDGAFTGIAIELRPRGRRIRHRSAREPGLRDVIRGIGNVGSYLALLCVIVVAGQLLSLAPAIATQILIDELILGQAAHWLNSVLLALGAALVCGVLIDTMRGWVGLYAGTQLAIDSTQNIVSRLMRMPRDYIRARNLGDLMSRLDSLVPLRRAVTDQAADVLGNFVLAALALIVMILYEPALGLVSVAGFAGSIFVLVSLLPRERRMAHRVLMHRATEKNSLLETFRAYDTVCGLGIGEIRAGHWQNRFFDATDAAYRAGKLAILRSTLTAVVTATEQLLFLAIGISFAMEQKISVGALFAFMSLRGRFSAAAMQLLGYVQQFGLLSVHVRRLFDLVSGEPARGATRGTVCKTVRGKIEVCGLTFAYSGDRRLFGPLDFTIGESNHAVITGPSGCGKTTLLHLLAGQLEPGTGIVRVDGIELSLWDRDAYTRQIGAVAQNEHLFHGTIADNIAAFDPEIDLAKVRFAALVADVWQDIQRMPMRTQTLLGDTGIDLSGGQVQRLALARAVYRRPRILFLDEATSHLDIDTETRILRNIRRLNITTVSVAHRPAAVSDASQVIRLGPGPASLPCG